MAKGILAVALAQDGKIMPASLELLTAARALASATQEPVAAVAAGSKAAAFAQELVQYGADKVFAVEHASLDNFNDELYTKAVADLVAKEGFARVLVSASVAGRSLAARLAVRLKAGFAADVSELAVNGTGLKAKRTQYSGNVVSDVGFRSPVQVAAVTPMVFPRPELQSGRSGEVVKVAFDPGQPRMEMVSRKSEESNEVDLGAAERIVAAGRGLGNPDGFKIVREFAASIGAAVGASRVAVDSGWIPYRHQVGLTGRTVRPKLYIACGISGQVQHLAGMSQSGTIVALNTDPDCPMMQTASIAVVGDLYELIPAIIAEIKKRRG